MMRFPHGAPDFHAKSNGEEKGGGGGERIQPIAAGASRKVGTGSFGASTARRARMVEVEVEGRAWGNCVVAAKG